MSERDEVILVCPDNAFEKIIKYGKGKHSIWEKDVIYKSKEVFICKLYASRLNSD